MHESKKKDAVIIIIILAAAVIPSALFAVFGHDTALSPLFALGGTVVFLTCAAAGMYLYLRASIKKTVYSYTNIVLAGGILFILVLDAINAGYLIYFLGEDELTLGFIYRCLLAFPKTFSYYAMFVVFAVSVLVGVSNIALMRHEGYRPKNALSLLVALVYIGGTFAVYFIIDLLEGFATGNGGMIDFAATTLPTLLLLIICYFECVLVGFAVMGWIAVRTKPKFDKDYIIILGCSIDRRGGLLPLLKGRVNRAVRFAWEQEIATGKPLKYVPSGGKGANEIMSEGSAMELYLKAHGAEDDEVFPEKESRDTYENMVFSKRIIDALDPDAKIAFATTNYHVLRSGIIARYAGVDAEGIASDTKWYFWPNGFVREFFGILAMKVRTHICICAVLAVICILVGLI